MDDDHLPDGLSPRVVTPSEQEQARAAAAAAVEKRRRDGLPVGVPFAKGDRNPIHAEKRRRGIAARKNLRSLLEWSGRLDAPAKLVTEMRTLFGLPPSKRLTVDEAVILRVQLEALRGSIAHVQFIAERMEGKVRQEIGLGPSGVLRVVEEVVDAEVVSERKERADAES